MGKKNTSTATDEALVNVIVEAMQDIKGRNITKIDLRNVKSSMCEYFIICEGESNVQVNALADNIEKLTYTQLQYPPHHVEGRENSEWILLDFFSVIVHVFQKEQRSFYKLEDLWSDGKLEVIPDKY
jgi:ribosome-associated protein